MEKLQAICFGGTNFHLDNKITADISNGTITLHDQFTIHQSNPFIKIKYFPPSRIRSDGNELCQVEMDQKVARMDMEVTMMDKKVTMVEQETRSRTINVPHRQMALPGEPVLIPLAESCVNLNRIAIIPSFQQMRTADWPAQVCEIEGGNAVYVNNSTETPISHPKFAHFKTLPVVEQRSDPPKLQSYRKIL